MYRGNFALHTKKREKPLRHCASGALFLIYERTNCVSP